MNAKLLAIFGLLVMFVTSCGGSGGGTPAPTTVTVAISPTTTGQLVSVTVTATFSGDITEPADQTAWLTAFKLQKSGAGDNLCTSIDYASKVATCIHGDLDYSSSYTVTVSGLTDQGGSSIDTATGTFETEGSALISVTGISKTSATTTGTSNEIDVTFTFDGTPEDTPSVSVDGGAPQACVIDGNSCSITLTGIKGCTTLEDYVLELTGTGINDYTYTINSADDEFGDEATFASCYTVSATNCTPSITEGEFMIDQPAADTGNCHVYKVLSDNFAVTLKTGSFSPGTVADGDRMQDFALADDNSPNLQVSLMYGASIASETNPQWGWMLRDQDHTYSLGVAISGTDPYGNSSLYKCLAFVGGKVYSYISEDGETFIHLTTTNTEAALGTDLPDSLDYTVTWAGDVRAKIAQTNTDSTGELTGTFEFLRFRSGDLNGTSADCPTLY